MQRFTAKPVSYLSALLACGVMSLAAGCASGGFKLTRQYAQFVNKQDLIIRIILYILTAVVFVATVLIDMVIFNTMDFWEGRVSAGSYEFKDAQKLYHAKHEYQPGTNLRRSILRVFDDKNVPLQEVVLTETAGHEIEVTVDGVLRGKVHSLSELPMISVYDAKGDWQEEKLIPVPCTNPEHKVAIAR